MITASEAVNVIADAGASVVATAPPAPPEPDPPPVPADPLEPPALVVPADPLEPPALVAPAEPPAGSSVVLGLLLPPLEHAAMAMAAKIPRIRIINPPMARNVRGAAQ